MLQKAPTALRVDVEGASSPRMRQKLMCVLTTSENIDSSTPLFLHSLSVYGRVAETHMHDMVSAS